MEKTAETEFEKLHRQLLAPLLIDGLMIDRNLIIAMEARTVCEAIEELQARIETDTETLSLYFSGRSRAALQSMKQSIQEFSILQDRLAMHKKDATPNDDTLTAGHCFKVVEKTSDAIAHLAGSFANDPVLDRMMSVLRCFQKTLATASTAIERHPSTLNVPEQNRPPKGDLKGPFRVELAQPGGATVRYIREDIYEYTRFENEVHKDRLRLYEEHEGRAEASVQNMIELLGGATQQPGEAQA